MEKTDPAWIPPPLERGEATPVTAPSDKAQASLEHLINKASRSVTDPAMGPPPQHIFLSPALTYADVEEGYLKASATAPGEGQVTTGVIRSIWDLIRGHLLHICQASLNLGYYPQILKRAKVIMLQKPGKRDL